MKKNKLSFLKKHTTTLFVSIFLLALVLIPWVSSSYITSRIFGRTLIFGIIVSSFVFLSANCGMMSLLQTSLGGIAGYTYAYLTVRMGWGPWSAVSIALLLVIISSIIFGVVAVRSYGSYFFMITLAIAILLYYATFELYKFTGGFNGINGIIKPEKIFGFIVDINDPIVFYYIVLVISLLIFIALSYLRNSTFGLALRGIRDNPDRMEGLGYNIKLLRVVGFSISGLVAGIGGLLAVWDYANISPETMNFSRIIDVIIAGVIGGMYLLEGAWIGAFFLTLISNFANQITNRFNTFIGLTLIVVVILFPEGFANAIYKLRKLLGLSKQKENFIQSDVICEPKIKKCEVSSENPEQTLIYSPIVQLNGVVKSFGGVNAVNGVNLEIPSGERHVIIGPNGAGKSTLFNLISGNFQVSDGKIFLKGRDVTKIPIWKRSRLQIGRTYQHSNLFEGSTVGENLYLSIMGFKPKRFYINSLGLVNSSVIEKAHIISDKVGVSKIFETKVSELSHGERRQLEIGMALGSDPWLILLDEPAAGLSQAEKDLLRELIQNLDKELTIILVEHNMELCMQIADRISIMHQGKIIAQGCPNDIETNQAVQEIYLGIGNNNYDKTNIDY